MMAHGETNPSISVTDSSWTCSELDCKNKKGEQLTFANPERAAIHNLADNRKKKNLNCPEQLPLYNDEECLEPCYNEKYHKKCSFYHEIGATTTVMQGGKRMIVCKLKCNPNSDQACNKRFSCEDSFVEHACLYHKLIPAGKNMHSRLKTFFNIEENRIANIKDYSNVKKQIKSNKRVDALITQLKQSNIDQSLILNGKFLSQNIHFVVDPQCKRTTGLRVAGAINSYKIQQQQNDTQNVDGNDGNITV